MDKKIQSLFKYAFIILFLLPITILITKSSLIFILITILISLYLAHNKKIKKFWPILLITSIIIRLITIFIFNYEQLYDFKILLEASKAFAQKDYSFNTWGHMKMWGYQTGFVIYQGTILKIFKNITVLKVLNAIYSSCLTVIIYYLSKKITNEKIARITSLAYMILPFPLFLNTVLTNQHLATILMYLSIILLFKDKTKNYIISAILLAISNIIRPEGIIILTTIIIYEIIRTTKSTIKTTIKKITIFTLIYIAINTTASQLIIKTNINPIGLSNQYPLWKFVLGVNGETCGYYTEDDLYVQMDKNKSLELIKERINNPIKIGKLIVCKIDKFWLQSSLIEEGQALENKNINILNITINFKDLETIVMNYNNQIYTIILILSVIGIISLRKTNLKEETLFFTIMMIVCFGAFLIVEIQPRYIYFIYIPIFVLSSHGIEYIENIIKKYKHQTSIK